MFVSCLMPTFGRGNRIILVEEAIECFLRQDYDDAELIVMNDTPGLELVYDGHPRVRIINVGTRYPTLSDKIADMCIQARGGMRARFDDDDLSLPWRLSESVRRITGDGSGLRLEWRAEDYWFAPTASPWSYNTHHANTHITAVWTAVAEKLMGGYPRGLSGNEDQVFNQMVGKIGGATRGELLGPERAFYVYRWGVSPHHLSGKIEPGEIGHQSHYDALGERPQRTGVVKLDPHWERDYVAMASAAVAATVAGSAS